MGFLGGVEIGNWKGRVENGREDGRGRKDWWERVLRGMQEKNEEREMERGRIERGGDSGEEWR